MTHVVGEIGVAVRSLDPSDCDGGSSLKGQSNKVSVLDLVDEAPDLSDLGGYLVLGLVRIHFTVDPLEVVLCVDAGQVG